MEEALCPFLGAYSLAEVGQTFYALSQSGFGSIGPNDPTYGVIILCSAQASASVLPLFFLIPT